MQRSLSAILIPALLMLSIVCEGLNAQTEPKYSIHFILPDGYVGVFRLVLDKEAGVEMKLENGRYALEIPKNGVLKIKSFRPFAELHEIDAAYKSGKKIPYDVSGSLMPKSIALRKVWVVVGDMDENGEMSPPVVWTYLIGTKQQADKLKRRLEKRGRA